MIAGFTACKNEELPVKLERIDDTGVATFIMSNEATNDIASFTVEAYLVISRWEDTVNYAVQERSEAFVEAGKETFIVQKIPPGTASATGKVLSFEEME